MSNKMMLFRFKFLLSDGSSIEKRAKVNNTDKYIDNFKSKHIPPKPHVIATEWQRIIE